MPAQSSSPIAVVGSANLDLVFRTPSLPLPGQTLLGGEFQTHLGGKGANQAVAIARLEGSVSFVGCVGADANGLVLRTGLESSGVDTSHLQAKDGTASGTAGILVGDDGMNMIVVAPGSNFSVTPQMVRESLTALAPKIVLAQLEIPIESVAAASEFGMFVLNPAPAREIPLSILSRCAILTPNETELAQLSGMPTESVGECELACRVLLDAGVQNVVVTMGSRGSLWANPAGAEHFPAATVTPVDTTAAGDAFNGGLCQFLAEGREMSNAIALANCVGALATTKHGAQEAMPTRAEVIALAGSLY